VHLVAPAAGQKHDRAVYLSIEERPGRGVHGRLTFGVLLVVEEGSLAGCADAEIFLCGSDPL
jgi:hypothetical protein